MTTEVKRFNRLWDCLKYQEELLGEHVPELFFIHRTKDGYIVSCTY